MIRLLDERRTAINEPARFAIVFAGVLVAINVSCTYAFALISPRLKAQFALSQTDISRIITAGNCFAFFSIPAGFLFDYFGPTPVLMIASTMASAGMFLFSEIFKGHVAGTLTTIIAANCLLSWGCSWQDVSSLMPSVLHFPLDKGNVIMIQKTFMGLGTTILAVYFRALFDGHEGTYTLFTGLMIIVQGFVAACIVQIPFYHVPKWTARKLSPSELQQRHDTLALYERKPADAWRFRIGFAILFVALVFFTSVSFLEAFVVFDRTTNLALAAASLGLTLSFALMALPRSRNSDAMQHELISVNAEKHAVPCPPWISSSFRESLVGEKVIWLMFWTSLCTWGTGVVVSSNAAQIFSALNHGAADARKVTLIVAVMGLASALGRICAGLLERQLSKRHKPMILVYGVAPLTTTLSGALFFVVDSDSAHAPFGLISFGFGFSWACTILVIRQTFLRDIGQHYNFCFVAGIFSTAVMNLVFFGPQFDDQARAQGTFPACSGLICFADTTKIVFGLGISSLLSSFGVYWSWKRRTTPQNSDERCAS